MHLPEAVGRQAGAAVPGPHKVPHPRVRHHLRGAQAGGGAAEGLRHLALVAPPTSLQTLRCKDRCSADRFGNSS